MRLYQMKASEDFRGDVCAEMGCESCEHIWHDLGAAIHECSGACPRCGGTSIGPRWECAERCGNCGKMDWTLPQGRWCSRICKLQGEYAASLSDEPSGDVVPISVSRSRLRGAAR